MLADEEKTVEGFAQKLYCAVDPKTGARFERTLDGATGLSPPAMLSAVADPVPRTYLSFITAGFHCFDTLPTITGQLEKHCAKLKNEGTAHLPTCFMGATVHGIGQLVSEWMQARCLDLFSWLPPRPLEPFSSSLACRTRGHCSPSPAWRRRRISRRSRRCTSCAARDWHHVRTTAAR